MRYSGEHSLERTGWRRGDSGLLLFEDCVVCHVSSFPLSQTADTMTGIPPGKNIRRAGAWSTRPHRGGHLPHCFLAGDVMGTRNGPAFSQYVRSLPPVIMIKPHVLLAPSIWYSSFCVRRPVWAHCIPWVHACTCLTAPVYAASRRLCAHK